MPSQALEGFRQALVEVKDLAAAYGAQGSIPKNPALARVVGRASVVLLSSHFERYIYKVNEEAAAAINSGAVDGPDLPETMRLLHSRPAIEEMLESDWVHRQQQLAAFVETDAWLWQERGGALSG